MAAVEPLGADFLWGVASSGYQSEGSAPDSNWSRRVAAGRTADPYLDAVDFLHRYPADIGLAAGLGARVYRIGLEWARLQPEPGVWDEDAFAFYDAVVAAILAAGLRPMLTLDHWVYPGWAADRGGWARDGMVADWLANMRRVVDRYAAHDPLWVTINEPSLYIGQEIMLAGRGVGALRGVCRRLVAAHRAIYDYIHSVRPDALVTSNVAYIPVVQRPVDRFFQDRIADKLDYVGIDYYYGASVATMGGLRNVANGRMWDAPLTAEGIYYVLRFYARRYPGKPLYIVENGMPTEDGKPRPDGWDRADLLRDTVYWIQRAVADGMNVIGYNYWSLTDNYEWGSYAPRFGLYTVDVKTDPTLARVPTAAIAAYRELIAAGGVAPGYRPTRAPVRHSVVDPPSSWLRPVAVPN